MLTTLISAVVTCVVSLALGQAALRLCGFRSWNWIAPVVGISIAMMISITAIHAPGRCVTLAILLAGLTLAAGVWCWRDPEHRPPLPDLLAAAPVAAMVLLPYLAVGRAGIPGVSMNNDWAMHLLWAEAIVSADVQAVTPLSLDYPIGPHAMAAVLTKGLGTEIDRALAGWAMALPLINAWTALALVRRARWLGKLAAATAVGMPFLVAAYHGQAAFKEVLLAGIILALVAFLIEVRSIGSRGRWVPLAVLVAGAVSMYSLAALPWPLLIVGIWLLVVTIDFARRHGLGRAAAAARGEAVPVAIAAAVLLVSLAPQIPRLNHFVSLRASVNGTGIQDTDLGNLVGPLPVWEAFGVWNNPDFRMPSSPDLEGALWIGFVVALVLFGTYWALRRGRWALPLAAAVSLLIWFLSEQSQSPYVTAKALVVASPLLLALAVLPLVERDAIEPPWSVIAPILALLLVGAVVVSDVRALRVSPVGPTDHVAELRSLRETMGDEPALFIGNDDFIQWELAGVPVSSPIVQGVEAMPIPPRKEWTYGRGLDFDAVGADVLNANLWVIAPRDPAASEPPPQMRLVRSTDSFSLWRRVGEVADRSILTEGDLPGAVLRCGTPAGRAILGRGGVAAVRPRPVALEPAATILPGQEVAVDLPLAPGRWQLAAKYVSQLPLEVAGAGLRETLPANLDRLGSRWLVGSLRAGDAEPERLTFRVEGKPFAPDTAAASLTEVVATRGDAERLVPVRQACGRYVDWYRSFAQ